LRHLRPAILLVCVLASAFVGASTADAPHLAFSIEPSKTRVGIARVHLVVGELRLTEGVLEGSYSIRVPLRPSKNESGTIRLLVPVSLEQIRREGANLAGHAENARDGERRGVICDVHGDGRIRIEITTDKRTLSFDSRYHLIG
jgi:hypothetical protein